MSRIISLPDEPEVGTTLLVHDPIGETRIRRGRKGWYLVDVPHGPHLRWHEAFRTWGLGSDPSITFEVM